MSIQEQYKARNYQDGRVRVEHVGSRLLPAATFDPYFYGICNDKFVSTYIYLLPLHMKGCAVAAGGVVV